MHVFPSSPSPVPLVPHPPPLPFLSALCVLFISACGLSSSVLSVLGRSPLPPPLPLLPAFALLICTRPFPSISSLCLLVHLHLDTVLFPLLWLALFFLFPSSSSLVPACGRSMTHNWRTWRPLGACLTFVTPSSSTGARLRRRRRTHLLLGSLRYVLEDLSLPGRPETVKWQQ